ncbi:hypothetical protein FGG08_002144 [Glutinoglossum americanum]|uniref:Major facilitator superfamily (MFS) profile domain-containing protein n=1 Tax=Glutinoglossum americanum TaxID=1670608 RepID=A0A9P8L4R5_9PEZI|nr:hypothetical protein FGG08_002144 [Glutinoglossum americanum]
MVESFGIPKNHVAFYAGATSAIFSLCQCFTAVIWGRTSDIYGRKPAILVGLSSTMLATILFGFSRSLAMAMVVRAFAGLGNGNVGIIRTSVAEMVPQKELQPRAFSVMPLVWTIGSIFGPGFGGFLANPVERHPDLFGGNRFFKTFPYALPNLVTGGLFLVGLVTGVLFMKETLETRKHRRDYGLELGEKLVGLFRRDPQHGRRGGGTADETTSLLSGTPPPRLTAVEDEEFHRVSSKHPSAKPTQSRPGFREVFSRQSAINLVAYSMLSMHSVSSDQLLPIFMHHPPQSHTPDNPDFRLPFKFAGGFGLNSQRIGFLFTLYGVCGMLAQFLIFPAVARRFGVLNCLKVCVSTFPIIYFLTPFTALISPGTTQQATMFALMLVKCVCVIFAFPCSTILLTNSAVSLQILGTLNGFATSIAAIGRAIGPAIGGCTFTLGVELGYVILPWWTITALSICGAVPVWMLVEMDGFGDSESESDSDSQGSVGYIDGDPECRKTSHVPQREASPDQNEQRHRMRVALFGPGGNAFVRADEDEFAIEDEGSPVSSVAGRKRSSSRTRRMSAPIGWGGILPVGPRRERRMSSAIAQCNNGSLI